MYKFACWGRIFYTCYIMRKMYVNMSCGIVYCICRDIRVKTKNIYKNINWIMFAKFLKVNNV